MENSLSKSVFNGKIILIGVLHALDASFSRGFSFPEPRDLDECLEEGLLRYPDDNECYHIFEQGPCQNGFWLVMDDHGIPDRGICRQIDCPLEDEIMIKGRCHKLGDSKPCPETFKVHVTLYGHGECDCEEGFVYDQALEKCLEQASLVPLQLGSVPTDCKRGYVLTKNGRCVKGDKGTGGQRKQKRTTLKVRRGNFRKFLKNRRNRG